MLKSRNRLVVSRFFRIFAPQLKNRRLDYDVQQQIQQRQHDSL